MLILTIRTDKPEAELVLYQDSQRLASVTWEAHRKLAETIHQKIQGLLIEQKLNLAAVQGIVVYKGPGSFTGLRIGMSVANALAYGLGIPLVAAGDDWIKQGTKQLLAGKSDKIALPEYGAPAHHTTPRK